MMVNTPSRLSLLSLTQVYFFFLLLLLKQIDFFFLSLPILTNAVIFTAFTFNVISPHAYRFYAFETVEFCFEKYSLSYLRVPTHLLVTTECIRTPYFFCIDTNAGLDHITWMYDYNIFYKPNFLLNLNALIWNFWIEFYFIYVHCILV